MAGEMFPKDTEKQKAFCMGAAYALDYDLTDFQEETSRQDDYPLAGALEMWLAYKKERKQPYKPRGLAGVKKRLMQLSGGSPAYAAEIVEFSIANNYSGLFAPSNNNANSYARQQQSINKATAILAG